MPNQHFLVVATAAFLLFFQPLAAETTAKRKTAAPSNDKKTLEAIGAKKPFFVLPIAKAKLKVHPKGARVRVLSPSNLSSYRRSAFMAHLTVPPGGAVPTHRDSTDEYLYVLKGSGVLWINKTKFKIKAGDSIFMPALAEVRFKNDAKPFEVIQFFAPAGPEAKYKDWKSSSEY